MEPWYRIVQPRKEVREGRSFDPSEFAIRLEQVVAGNAPEDYQNPEQFFARTCFTKALKEYSGMVLKRLSGRTENTAPVLSMITQFGGGKTHTLTTLYHLINHPDKVMQNAGVAEILREAGLTAIPQAKVAVFVGSAWDPQTGKETPWIDIARQLAGDAGVAVLGTASVTTPPGTETLEKIYRLANAPVLLLFDEVLNFTNRHRGMADAFYSFIDNLSRSMTGISHSAAVISLPRSQVEMTDWDYQWQEKVKKVVGRVAKDLIANDEAEISEVVRKRLFEDLGRESDRKKVAKSYAQWCFERRAQLPPEWTAVDAYTSDTKAKEFLQKRFEACYPFHPATLSVFQRKWQALPQYQQTRGTIAMLAQWISIAYHSGFEKARNEPLITLGSAPLEEIGFRSAVLGELNEDRLISAIESDITGEISHANALDSDSSGQLKHIHKRVGATILFESSGGQKNNVAHLPEIRFALGEPGGDTTSIDSVAMALENRAYFIRKVGTDGYQIHYKPTLKKVVNDRLASLDYETEIQPAVLNLVKNQFNQGSRLPIIYFPEDGTEVSDTAKLTLAIINPELEWEGNGYLRKQLAEWTLNRGSSPRLYPGAIIWCIKKVGKELKNKVELWLAWRRVEKELNEGTLGSDFERSERTEVIAKTKEAEEAAKDEVWGGYRYIALLDSYELDKLKVIDLGAGHSSSGESLSGRVISALKSNGLLNESIGASYLERNWPPALVESGAWSLKSLRQSFLNGSLTRLVDPEVILRIKLIEFVSKGEFGIASGLANDGVYERIWFNEQIPQEEISFDADIYLVRKNKAVLLKGPTSPEKVGETFFTPPREIPPLRTVVPAQTELEKISEVKTLYISGIIPPEIWNLLGTKFLPRLHQGKDMSIEVNFRINIDGQYALNFERELRQVLADLGLEGKMDIK